MAIFVGVVGSLLGVVIGAFLTRWIDSGYERRREIQTAIAAALLLRSELMDARLGIKVIFESHESSGIFQFAGLGAWDEHSQILLSAGMKHSEWMELSATFRHLVEISPLLKKKISNLPADARGPLETAQEACKDGEKLLEPFIVEGRVPFFRPESVFSGSA